MRSDSPLHKMNHCGLPKLLKGRVQVTQQQITKSYCRDTHRYFDAKVDELTLKNVVLHSVATALASMVLPARAWHVSAAQLPCAHVEDTVAAYMKHSAVIPVPGSPNIRRPCREH